MLPFPVLLGDTMLLLDELAPGVWCWWLGGFPWPAHLGRA